jgi:hypothetical protein
MNFNLANKRKYSIHFNKNGEGVKYVSAKLEIDRLSDVKAFYNYISNMETEVILNRGNFQCDASSLLGVFALDTSIPFTVSYDPKEVGFENYIKQFEVK